MFGQNTSQLPTMTFSGSIRLLAIGELGLFLVMVKSNGAELEISFTLALWKLLSMPRSFVQGASGGDTLRV